MVARKISDSEKNEILNLKDSDITLSLLKSYFAVKQGQDAPRFNTYDKFTLPKGKFYNDKEEETTIGRYIFNFFVLPKKYLEKYGYQNYSITKKGISNIENQLASMLLDDEITVEEQAEYLNRAKWLTLGTAHFLVPTMDLSINIPIPEVIERRDYLFDKHKKAIQDGDTNIVDMIETELIGMARQILKDKKHPANAFFESGGFSFENNYKKTSIMGGAMENPYTGKIDILKSNYIDGISKEELPYFANSTITGGYARGVQTQKAGYTTKKINNATQSIVLDEAETDCKTTNFLEVVIDKNMKSMFLYRWILGPGGKLIMLDSSNIDSYVGKTVEMRSPMFCKSEHICSKCAGDLYHRMGIRNAGLLSSTLSGSLMNLALKKTHDQTIRFDVIDIEEFIKER